jgi:hypothetical protein
VVKSIFGRCSGCSARAGGTTTSCDACADPGLMAVALTVSSCQRGLTDSTIKGMEPLLQSQHSLLVSFLFFTYPVRSSLLRYTLLAIMIGRISSLICLVLALGAAAIPSNTEFTTAASTKRMFGNPNIAPPPHVDGPRFNGTRVAARDAHELSTRDAVSFPRWVVYSDSWVSGESGPPAASSLKGFNTL